MIVNNFILFFLAISIASSTLNAAPAIDDENATLALILLNVTNDDTYVVDLDINILDFNRNPKNFSVDVIKVINTALAEEEKIESVQNFRWSLAGGIFDGQRYLGHIGAYNSGIKPWHTGSWKLLQRIKRLGYLFKAKNFEGEGNNVSIRYYQASAGHWDELWQGSFDGNGGKDDMLARAGKDSLIIWSLFSYEGKLPEDEIYQDSEYELWDWEKISQKQLGEVQLSDKGLLEISVDNTQDSV